MFDMRAIDAGPEARKCSLPAFLRERYADANVFNSTRQQTYPRAIANWRPRKDVHRSRQRVDVGRLTLRIRSDPKHNSILFVHWAIGREYRWRAGQVSDEALNPWPKKAQLKF